MMDSDLCVSLSTNCYDSPMSSDIIDRNYVIWLNVGADASVFDWLQELFSEPLNVKLGLFLEKLSVSLDFVGEGGKGVGL